MSYERWNAWLKNARALREKYDKNKRLIIKELIRLRPRWLASYESKESLVLLYLLHKIVESQKLLYVRFINGSDLFLSAIEKEMGKNPDFLEICGIFREINRLGNELSGVVEREGKTLSALHAEFGNINAKVELRNIEGGIFFTKINERILKNIAERLLSHVPESEEITIKRAHKQAINDNKHELMQIRKIHSMIKRLNERSMLLFAELSGKGTIRQAANAVYLSAYIAFFFGLIEYNVFSPATSIARELAIPK